ncbi:MAG TPA: tail fiber protein [Mucilaginibacter sp.]|jgi:microcystin-dependent protein|nr:tail fiber protein [Mucilaginibacter sp.]
MTPDLAMIYLFGSNFAPSGYQMCNGQIIAISTNTALFSLLGTFYGGNGTSNFALPDLRGRAPIHQGQGPGLSQYNLGQAGGSETITLTTAQMPSHSHAFNVNASGGTTAIPGSTTYLSAGPATGSGPNASSLNSYTTNAPNATLSPNAIGSTGGGQPFSIIQPYLAVTYVIAMQGVFPSRN